MKNKLFPFFTLILFFLTNSCYHEKDSEPLTPTIQKSSELHSALDDFKSKIQEGFETNLAGESKQDIIHERYGSVFWDAFAAFETSREAQIGFIPLFRTDSEYTEAVLIASLIGDVPHYTFLARGYLYIYSDWHTISSEFPSLSIMAGVFTSFDNAIFGDSDYDYMEIIGRAPRTTGGSRRGVNIENDSGFNNIKSEWVGREICEFTFTGTHDEPYQYLTDIYCYTDWIWESLPREPEMLDYNPGGGGGVGGSYSPSPFLSKMNQIDKIQDPRAKALEQLNFILGNADQEDREVAKVLLEILSDLLWDNGSDQEINAVIKAINKLWNSVKAKAIIATFNPDTIATFLSFGIGNAAFSNTTKASIYKITARYVSQNVGKGFTSFNKFKAAFGSAGAGNNWHHIVSQRASNLVKFGANKVHNSNNLVKLPSGSGSWHQRITNYYNSIPREGFTNGKRFGEWLAEKSFQEQYEWGMKIMNMLK